MPKYLKKFETISQYNAYTADTANFIKPNVSLTVDNNTVHYNPWVETRVVAKYNVTDTSNPTQIAGSTNNFSKIEVDGIEITLGTGYTFETTGEHTVKYTLTDPTSIGSQAFFGCSDITSITLPDSVTSLGEYAFARCYNVANINIPSGVTSISGGVFMSCRSLISIDIPNSVTIIGSQAFDDCRSLTSIVIPSGVTSIGGYAFESCTSLTSIDIPNSVTSIGNQAFYMCSSLTSIDIPSGVTSIGADVFGSCSGLTSIVSNAITAPTITSYTFRDVKTGGTLTVPSGSSGYDVWMRTSNYYLGKYGWTKVEQ